MTNQTAFTKFNQRLHKSRMAFIDYEILRDESILKEFILESFALRKIYEKVSKRDIHGQFLQPKVQNIFELIQKNIEDVRNLEPMVWNQISIIQEQLNNYVVKINQTPQN
jgi:hypothetical protein